MLLTLLSPTASAVGSMSAYESVFVANQDADYVSPGSQQVVSNWGINRVFDTFAAEGNLVYIQGTMAASEAVYATGASVEYISPGSQEVTSWSGDGTGTMLTYDTMMATGGSSPVVGSMAASESVYATAATVSYINPGSQGVVTWSGDGLGSDLTVDTFAASGVLYSNIQGTMSASEAGFDSFASTGSGGIFGYMAADEHVYAAAATVTYINPGSQEVTSWSGDGLGSSLTVDTFSATGNLSPITGFMAANEGTYYVAPYTEYFSPGSQVVISWQMGVPVVSTSVEVFAATGTVTPVAPITGSMAAVEVGADTFLAASYPISQGSMGAVEVGGDTAFFTGQLIPNIFGTLIAIEIGMDKFASSSSAIASALTDINFSDIIYDSSLDSSILISANDEFILIKTGN